ncbi:MAG: ribokinase [Devosia sp. 67-54]|uniref:ribokinase n=1 Tax=unclassified Devosia TaxID=196773 RepID=UPI0009591151|nr:MULTISPECIES: ribokinase [unclassified Devosia]MBN9304855.1 ribokinase [Devosia sp.]OJX15191.1 MAG: ribokinase [Devosia sp. 67-54]
MITVLGSVNLDLIATVSRIPHPGETVPGTSFATAPGGKGANQALAAARAGGKVKLVSAAGKDRMGDEALALLRQGGVDLGAVRRLDLQQGVAMIMVDAAGENIIGIVPGTNGTLTPEDADTAVAALTDRDVLVVQQEIPQAATMRALGVARLHGATTILNTAPFLDTTAAVAGTASIVVANETEFALLSGGEMGDLRTAMSLWARSRRQTIIVTLGPDGAVAATPDDIIAVPALPVEPVDTVGAGDTFVGYLAAGLDAGLDLAAAMRRAAIAASLACLKPGAQPAIPLLAEVEAASA